MFKITPQQFDVFYMSAEKKFLLECENYLKKEIDHDWLATKSNNLTEYIGQLYIETKNLNLVEKNLIIKYMLACIMTDENEKGEKEELIELKAAIKKNEYDIEELLNNFLEYYI